MADSSSWWVLIPASDKGESAAKLDQVDFRTTGLSASQIKTLQSGGQINDYGMEMVLWKGPFSTEAEAQAAQNPTASPSGPAALGNAAGQAAANAAQGIFGGKVGPSDLVRIGQVLLGLILIAVAAARITGAENIVSKVIK